MTEVLNDSLENVSFSVVSKFEMRKSEMTQESNLSKLKSEVQISQEAFSWGKNVHQDNELMHPCSTHKCSGESAF